MTPMLVSGVGTVGGILAALLLVALVEAVIPLRARGYWHRTHLVPNLALTGITFGTNLVMNGALVLALERQAAVEWGVLRQLALPPVLAVVVVVATLDFSFYVAHVAMHHVPWLWRFHAVHHADPAVDVTTTIRQHPGEGVIRYAFLGAFACALGADPAAFAIYRTWSALNALLEHANVRVPPRVGDALALVTTWPDVHKVHHSRAVAETNTNYGNIFSIFDRAFGTFTPSRRGRDVVYGLDGLDEPETQTLRGLLALPFRRANPAGERAAAA